MGARRLDMGDATATLDSYNSELSKCIEELENKRKAISTEIDLEQQKKTDVQTQLRELTEKLSRINDSLGRKVSAQTSTTPRSRRRRPRILRSLRAHKLWTM